MPHAERNEVIQEFHLYRAVLRSAALLMSMTIWVSEVCGDLIVKETAAPGTISTVEPTHNGAAISHDPPIPIPFGPPDKDGTVTGSVTLKDMIHSTDVTDYWQVSNVPATGVIEQCVGALKRQHSLDFVPLAPYLAETLGIGVPAITPDIIGDTNGNGRLDNGDHLFSAVNLDVWLQNPPSVHIGDTFTINNGVSAALPGFVFGTERISYDPSVGFFTNAPFSGAGLTEALHETSAVPEPPTLITAGIATLVGLTFGWRRVALVARPPVLE